MIVKVKEPLKAEYGCSAKARFSSPISILAASKELTEALLKSGVIGVAYETIQVGNKLPLLEPMSEIAGRMSIVMGPIISQSTTAVTGYFLVASLVFPGRVVVIGGGTSGVNAARMAIGLAAYFTKLHPQANAPAKQPKTAAQEPTR